MYKPKNKEDAIKNMMKQWKITYWDAKELIYNFEIRQSPIKNKLIEVTYI
jgi:hypothetical protein